MAGLAASLARYEGWFVIPFVAFYFLFAARRHKIATALLFGGIAALGPLYWLGHNWCIYCNPLEFYNGPYSAQTFTARRSRRIWHPIPAITIGAKLGCSFALRRAYARVGARWPWRQPDCSALVGSVFSGRSGSRRCFRSSTCGACTRAERQSLFPQLWFSSYYNTRYGLAALPLLAIAGGCVVLIAGNRLRPYLAAATVAIAVSPWLIHPQPDNWICWKESQVNSEARRAWTRDAANFLAAEYQPGQGIFTSFGDLTGIFREAGIPLRDTLHQGNVLEWLSATRRPDLFLRQRWAVAIAGDEVATAVEQATRNTGPRYHLVQSIQVQGRSGNRNLQARRHMTIPFTKAHGAGNDFLLSWSDRVPSGDLPGMARAICDRHTGIGADGWILLRDTSIRLFNADGSEAEMSGNGTRCAAALLIDSGQASEEITILTGAGPKRLAPARSKRAPFPVRNGHGQTSFRRAARSVSRCRFAMAHAGSDDSGCRQSTVRGLRRRFPGRLGDARGRDRSASAFSQSAPMCRLFEAWTRTPSRPGSTSAAPA